MKTEAQSSREVAPVESAPRCAWERDAGHDDLDDDPFVLDKERCTTGKPALFYNCNENGPVCEEHVCRCHPSLLTERAEKARRDLIARAIQSARGAYGQGLISDETLRLVLRDLGESSQGEGAPVDPEDAAIDELFSRIDEKLRAGDFAGVDAEMQAVDVSALTTTMLLAWLSITASASGALRMRATLVSRVRARLEQTEPSRADALLAGLG